MSGSRRPWLPRPVIPSCTCTWALMRQVCPHSKHPPQCHASLLLFIWLHGLHAGILHAKMQILLCMQQQLRPPCCAALVWDALHVGALQTQRASLCLTVMPFTCLLCRPMPGPSKLYIVVGLHRSFHHSMAEQQPLHIACLQSLTRGFAQISCMSSCAAIGNTMAIYLLMSHMCSNSRVLFCMPPGQGARLECMMFLQGWRA